jgi:hypothetical protein
MRWILLSSLALLGGYYLCRVAPLADAPPEPVPGTSLAATLARSGAEASREGRDGDARALLRKATELEPESALLRANLERAEARALKEGWRRALLLATAGGGALFLAGAIRGARDRRRLAALRVLGEPRLEIGPATERAELAIPLNAAPGCLVRRHPLTIVWSSAQHGRHMKSRPPARARGAEIAVTLDANRLGRLRAHPGFWRAFLYLGKTQVGEATARVLA